MPYGSCQRWEKNLVALYGVEGSQNILNGLRYYINSNVIVKVNIIYLFTTKEVAQHHAYR